MKDSQKIAVQKHFVEFVSPGTFFPESTEKEIDSWNVKKAQKMSESIEERYGATPYAFRFKTRGRSEGDLDSKVIKSSRFYYLNAKVETYEEVVARNLPDEKILRDNMRINGIKKVVTNGSDSKTYKFHLPFEDGDVIL
jgi:hypothetical protein